MCLACCNPVPKFSWLLHLWSKSLPRLNVLIGVVSDIFWTFEPFITKLWWYHELECHTKSCFAIFKVKISVRAHVIKIWPFLLYLLNCWFLASTYSLMVQSQGHLVCFSACKQLTLCAQQNVNQIKSDHSFLLCLFTARWYSACKQLTLCAQQNVSQVKSDHTFVLCLFTARWY